MMMVLEIIMEDYSNIDPNNDNLISDIRLSTMGFIFQDFRLFENEIVIENLLFPLETLTNLDEEKNNGDDEKLKIKEIIFQIKLIFLMEMEIIH